MKDGGERLLDDEAWTAILDDFDQLANGGFTDADGIVWSGVLIFGTADLEQLCLQWGLKSYNSPLEMCGYCRGNRHDSTIPHTDLQEGAAWRPTEEAMTNEVSMDNGS